MWFYIKNKTIQEGPMQLPNIWIDNTGVKHHLRKMLREQPTVLTKLGWLRQVIVPTPYDTETQEVGSYVHTINIRSVSSIEQVVNKNIGEVRELRILQVKKEGLARIKIIMPAIKDFDDLELVKEQWLSLAPTARSPTTTFQSIIDIYQAGRNAITTLKGYTTWNEVATFDAVTSPAWP